MAIDDHTLDQLAELARLEPDAAARATMRSELDAILALIDTLRAIDVRGISPLAHPIEAHARLRPDEPQPPPPAEALLALSPHAQGGYYTVPRVIE